MTWRDHSFKELGSITTPFADTALIEAPSRAGDRIFGMPLLERMILTCQRAGISRFFVAVPADRREEIEHAAGRFRNGAEVSFIESFDRLLDGPFHLSPDARCVALEGNLVFWKSHLAGLLAEHASRDSIVARTLSADPEHGGTIASGPLGELISNSHRTTAASVAPGSLPFALNGHPTDREEAELQLARNLRRESLETDAPIARMVDRRVSWRISRWLAHTRVSPNQVTLANTCLGIGCAVLFAMPGYGWRLVAALLFLVSVTLDGVDGELARLRMSESSFGARLDTITDNVVHFAVFTGLVIGCYRASASPLYLYLLPVLLGGFSLCAVTTYRAFHLAGEEASGWIEWVHRTSGRDFAYVLVILALINRLSFFVWGTALGTYVYAGGLWWLTERRRRRDPDGTALGVEVTKG